jgi:hypothetical protein
MARQTVPHFAHRTVRPSGGNAISYLVVQAGHSMIIDQLYSVVSLYRCLGFAEIDC